MLHSFYDKKLAAPVDFFVALRGIDWMPTSTGVT